MKFIYPTAKRRRLACMNRAIINQWFDLLTLKNPGRREEIQIEGLRESTSYIHEIIADEARLVGYNNVILGGLSEGCAAALYASLTFTLTNPPQNNTNTALGALIGMSGWLPFQHRIVESLESRVMYSQTDNVFDHHNEPNLDARRSRELQAFSYLRQNIDLPPLDSAPVSALMTPVFLRHGTADEKVDVSLGERATATLQDLGLHVSWVPHQGFHHWHKVPEEIDDIVKFLGEKMGLVAV